MKDFCTIPESEYLLFKPVLKAIISVTAKYDLKFILIGAAARDILIKFVYHCDIQYRATLDIDFAVMLQNWESFQNIIDDLVSQHGFEKGKEQHRLRFESIIVDIIPFGKIAKHNAIYWPPDEDIIMNIIGFQEVYDQAIQCRLNSLSFKTTCLEGFVILKLIAWNDRKLVTAKDAEDLGIIFYNYNELFPDELFEDYSYLIDDPDYDYILAGIIILAKKLKIFISHSKELRSQIISILTTELEDKDNSLLARKINKIEKYEYSYEILKTILDQIS
ncbi:MAG: nucleotidyl transferase AbiEii/AbiGii toxin family protein [Candidatus Cloacimonetes bacterium]|nr:nucleotidyl transferase AbiEii/AbiGii toxin family protein [Candidatus Cloacimonadota bacterium]